MVCNFAFCMQKYQVFSRRSPYIKAMISDYGIYKAKCFFFFVLFFFVLFNTCSCNHRVCCQPPSTIMRLHAYSLHSIMVELHTLSCSATVFTDSTSAVKYV